MAILISSTPSTPTTSEALPATTSSAPTEAPLSCTQMAGSMYSEKFAISCDTISTGESIYRRDEEDGFESCLAKCDNEVRCIAVNFYPSPYSECDLIESFAGTRPSSDVHFASKVILTSTASTSSESIQPTSMSSSMLSSDLPESTSEAISTSAALSSAPEPTTDTSAIATASIDNTTSLGMSTFETSTTKTSTTEAPVPQPPQPCLKELAAEGAEDHNDRVKKLSGGFTQRRDIGFHEHVPQIMRREV
ncbi:hypothetical protein NW768_004193 [Fusarium equiseti]|uniref:Apple domain-containing protein n=1 Tax=Fusarium equiseti TaxID=61235 RepID=A0ABQ8RJZ5_FUSEQ|nr:hypothetical protein NW768_004193 [Fusarium equiseti]